MTYLYRLQKTLENRATKFVDGSQHLGIMVSTSAIALRQATTGSIPDAINLPVCTSKRVLAPSSRPLPRSLRVMLAKRTSPSAVSSAMPVEYYSALMTVAYGGNAKQTGLDGQIIKAKKLEEIAGK